MPPKFTHGLDVLCRRVGARTADLEGWSARIEAGLDELLSFLDDEAEWTRVLVLEAPLAGDTTQECARRLCHTLHPVLQHAREEVIVGAEIRPAPALLAELVVLGGLSVIRGRLLKGGAMALSELGPSLSEHVIGPYLRRGAERADRAADERRRGSSELHETDARAEMVPIRPHPRTLQALRVIASAPRLSTREVGRAIGVDTSSGHMSGLLRRLERRGLIENASSRQQPRQPSTWFLTPYGHRVLEVIASSFASAESAEQPARARAPR